MEAKKKFWDKVIEKTKKQGNSSSWFRAVSMFKNKSFKKDWDITGMYPGMTNKQIAEIVAEFFNKISLEYQPLPDPSRPLTDEIEYVIPQFKVAQRLKHFKKPKSQVLGDIEPELVTKFADLLAVPLAYIYNLAIATRHSPKIWKTETVTIILKNNSPSELSELKNLSCTPLFSKVFESFLLEKLKEEITLSNRQYGGIKGCSTEHFLLDTWDQIMDTLEELSLIHI